MKKLIAVVIALFMSSVAKADLVLHIEDVIVSSSDTGPTTGFLEVYLEETAGTQAAISTYNVGLRLQPTGIVTFTGQSAAVTHPSLFLGQTPTDRTATASGYVAGNDRLLTDDFVVNGNAADAPVQNGTRDGLFRVSFNVPQGALGVFLVNFDAGQSELADSGSNPVAFTADSGSITVVPEPTVVAFAALAGSGLLFARRRRI